MGKRRNTAKTGDRAIYKGRPSGKSSTKKDDGGGDDPMYDEIDRFHNDKNKDFLRLDGGQSDDDDDQDDGISGQEAIMDLGAVDDDDDDDDDDKSSSDGSEPPSKYAGASGSEDDEDEVSLSSDDSSVGETKRDYQMGDPRNWGKKKGAYYHGDTADLEIGQDEEDAFLEEEAAKEVQAARLKEMREDDFMLSGDEEEEEEKTMSSGKKKNGKDCNQETAKESLTAARDLSKLSSKAKRKLLRTQHPELLPIASYFADIVSDLKNNTMVATKALFECEEGTAEVSQWLGRYWFFVCSLFRLLVRAHDRLGYRSQDYS
jgi:U3 small nucleolar RNA-associated protein 3